MRQIGRIQVPEEFLKELVENWAYSLLAEGVINADLPNYDTVQKEFEATGIKSHRDIKDEEFIIALIRTQTNDWVRDNDEIIRSMDCKAIYHESRLLGIQMAYEHMTPDSALMMLALKELPPDKHPPISL